MEDIEATLRNNLGQIMMCRDADGHKWASKLVNIADGICYFELKDGRIVGNLLEDIVEARRIGIYSKRAIFVDN